jgi:hypothetical protein
MTTTFKNRPGQGVLLTNNSKTADNQPDYKGELVLDQAYGEGSVIKIAGWRKTTKINHLIALSIDKRQNTDKQWPKQVGSLDDNDVPF